MQMVNFYCCSILQNLCFLQGHHGGFYPATMVKEKRLGKRFPFDTRLLDFELEVCGLTTGLLLPFSIVKAMLKETSCLPLEAV